MEMLGVGDGDVVKRQRHKRRNTVSKEKTTRGSGFRQ